MYRREALKKTAMGMGIVLSGSTVSAILKSCSPSNLGWTPKVFSKEQAVAVANLLDVIIPETETPGALSLLVDRFVDAIIDLTYTDDDKEVFLQQLNHFGNTIADKYGKTLQKCSQEEKEEIVRELEEDSLPFPDQVWGKLIVPPYKVNFYRKMKSIAMLGYYSSEEVGKNIFNYDPIPGKQEGCIPLKDIGNAWTEG
ncbi:gluconate 2-dehydrogenase subunit 3 family protein [Flagellimonas flava]|uniref:gluconate 2-dehydrogenase subunit 3 family protein n=1 Tax=Flagellimonas flava TaxID=570519 RepID=UPI003D656CA5